VPTENPSLRSRRRVQPAQAARRGGAGAPGGHWLDGCTVRAAAVTNRGLALHTRCLGLAAAAPRARAAPRTDCAGAHALQRLTGRRRSGAASAHGAKLGEQRRPTWPQPLADTGRRGALPCSACAARAVTARRCAPPSRSPTRRAPAAAAPSTSAAAAPQAQPTPPLPHHHHRRRRRRVRTRPPSSTPKCRRSIV
jgi:hypothetical protein